MTRQPFARRCTASLLLALLACGDAVAPLPRGAVPMDPLPQYATWWSITEQCSGLSGDMSAIQWYTVPGRGTLNDDNADGIYFIESHRIVLAGDSVSSGQLVRHEMLHALGATPGHPAQYFQDLCGGIVDCEEACIRSGGGAPPVDSLGPLVQPSEMTITATADPRVPLQSRESWLELTVEARNPFPYAVRVQLTKVLGTTKSETFGYKYATCEDPNRFHLPIYDWIEGETLVLGPGATKRRMFDIPDWRECRILTPYFNNDTLAKLRIDPTPKPSREGVPRAR